MITFNRCESKKIDSGFALIATITLLVLLVLVVLALVQLSTSEQRGSRNDKLMAQAQANARMALQLAIGQLQQEMGPDQRISATAGILDADPTTEEMDDVANPHYTGVWNAAPSRLGDAPDTSLRWTLDKVTYDAKKLSSFKSWLVSGALSNLSKMDYAKTGPANTAKSCELVSERTDAKGNVIPKVSVDVIEGKNAGFAWWTSDNGVKAHLRGRKPETLPVNKAEILLDMRRANADGHMLIDDRIPERSNGLDGRIIDLASIDTAVPAQTVKVSRDLIHDLTTDSDIIPVDVTKGGLKSCLNLKLDWLQGLTKAQREAEGTLGIVENTAPTNAEKDYRLFAWDQLRHYESISRNSGQLSIVNGRPRVKTYTQNATEDSDINPSCRDFRFRLQPVMIKISYLVSYNAEKIGADGAPDEFALRLYFYPMVVLWNPYNVDMVIPDYCPTIIRCPVIIKYNEGLPNAYDINLINHGDTYTHMPFGANMGGAYKMRDLVIPAGSTRVLYPQQSTDPKNPPRPNSELYLWAQDKEFDLGLSGNYGAYTKNLRGGAELRGAGDDLVIISATPSTNGDMTIEGAHTTYWGNYGGSSQNKLHWFNTSTHVGFNFNANSPQYGFIPSSEVPTRTYKQLSEVDPQPLFMFDVYRKPADETQFPSKVNLFSSAGNALSGAPGIATSLDAAITRWFESPFSIRFKSINSWAELGNYCQWAPGSENSIYFGNSYMPDGQLSVVDQEIPLSTLTSIAGLQHLPIFDFKPLIDGSAATFSQFLGDWYRERGQSWFYWGRLIQFGQNHAIGNSFASPGIRPEKLTEAGWDTKTSLVNHTLKTLRKDRSYIANSVLWDGWFCSSIAAQDGLMLTTNGQAARTTRMVAEDFINNVKELPNDNVLLESSQSADAILDALFETTGKPKADAFEKVAGYLRIRGGFNVNSVSEKAWAHFLSNLLSRPVLMMESKTGTEGIVELAPEAGKFLITRTSLVNAPPAERASEKKEREDRYWNGAREVTAEQIEELAKAIVKQVKRRGPFLSLSEFVNRKLTSDTTEQDLALSGALQSALDDNAVTINAPFRGDTVPINPKVKVNGVDKSPTYPFPAAAAGPRRQGITGYVTQADILSTVGNTLTPRSDTFTIRAMGEVRSEDGQKVLATAWCEAVVQRGAEYVDPKDAANVKPELISNLNKKFGRKFTIISFRWLKEEEL